MNHGAVSRRRSEGARQRRGVRLMLKLQNTWHGMNERFVENSRSIALETR